MARRGRYVVAKEPHSRAYPFVLSDSKAGEVLARLSERWIAEAIRDRLNDQPVERPQAAEDD